MIKLVLLRHGQSTWNKEKKFTGWTDVGLTEQGEKEAKEAGKTLLENGFEFDIAYTSVLKRATHTLELALEEMDMAWLPVHKSWRLNEKHYGALQGFGKVEMAEKEGAEQVHLWRRDYNTRPPALTKDDKRWPGHEAKYHDVDEKDLPLTECLKDTVERFLPYWKEEIAPAIKSGKKVLISAHGNSLRALIKYLDNMTDEEIPNLNIPTGVPLVYELDDDLKPIRHYYLGDQEKIAAAADLVKNEAK